MFYCTVTVKESEPWGGYGEVFTLPIDQRGNQHGISLRFIVEQVKFIPLQNRATGTSNFLPLGHGLVLATIIKGWGLVHQGGLPCL